MVSSAAEFYSPFTTTTLPCGVTYRYLHIQPASPEKPYLLFLHGYPSAAYDWRHQIKYFSALGYGIIVPDLLGYGGTDKPADPAAYRMKKMAAEVVELLDHVGVRTVIGIGHDWGSGMLSGLANFQRDRLQALAYLAVGYIPPTPDFDLYAAAAAAEKVMGYPSNGYWEFHNEDDAGKIIDEHSDSYFTLVYPQDPAIWRTHLAPFGAAKEWTMKDTLGPIAPFISDEDKAIHDELFSSKNGGYGPPLNWYKAMVRKLNNPDNAECLKLHTKIKQPLLLITAKRDVVSFAALQEKVTETNAEYVRVERLDTGHWIQLEVPDETNRILQSFFEEVSVKSKV